MKIHTSLNDEVRDKIILYSLNALDPAEAAEFEAHLKAGCELCRSELQAFQKVTDHLNYSARLSSPAPRVREDLFAQIQKEPNPSSEATIDQAGLLVLHASQMGWTRAGEAPIYVKDLFLDKTGQTATQLLRAAAGTRFPDHRHADVEEVYVLEGDLKVGSEVLRSGDYCRAEPGTIHRDVSTQAGCTLLVRSSQHNELLLSHSPVTR